MDIKEVRHILATRKHRCDPECPGWFVTEDEPLHIERCDECFACQERKLTDDDVALLPEAEKALKEALP